MFRRKSETAAASEPAETAEPVLGKGRPTPKRRDAEAAAKARAKVPKTRADARAARAENSRKVREAMKTGDERYLMARDKGPVRRFVRDFVDHRLTFLELLLPILLAAMIFTWTGNATLYSIGTFLMIGMILLAIFDMVMLRFRLRRELARRFPDTTPKGTTYYAITRAMQLRFLRLPKPQVKLGQPLPEHYR